MDEKIMREKIEELEDKVRDQEQRLAALENVMVEVQVDLRAEQMGVTWR